MNRRILTVSGLLLLMLVSSASTSQVTGGGAETLVSGDPGKHYVAAVANTGNRFSESLGMFHEHLLPLTDRNNARMGFLVKRAHSDRSEVGVCISTVNKWHGINVKKEAEWDDHFEAIRALSATSMNIFTDQV